MALTPDDPGLNVDPPRERVVINWTDRWILPLLCVGVVLDFLMSGGLIWLKVTGNNTQDQAHSAQVAQYQSCQDANQSRAQSDALWTFLIDESYTELKALPAAKQAPEKAELAKIAAHVREAYSQRDCSKYKP